MVRDAAERFYHEGRKAFYRYEKKQGKYFIMANPYSATFFVARSGYEDTTLATSKIWKRLNAKS